jgi:Flp pilus assembly pilin Flp
VAPFQVSSQERETASAYFLNQGREFSLLIVFASACIVAPISFSPTLGPMVSRMWRQFGRWLKYTKRG